MGFWGDCGTSGVMVCSTEFVKSASPREVVRVIHFGLVVLIDGHHVLKIVTLGGVFRTLSYPTIIFLLEDLLVLRDVALPGLVLESSKYLALETLRGVMRVALSVKVLGVDSGNEASIARDALVADLVSGAVHPRDARLAHVASRSSLLRLFRGAIH